MKDILFECGNCQIISDGDKMILFCRFEGDRCYYEYVLRDEKAYQALLNEFDEVCKGHTDDVEFSDTICDILQTTEWAMYFAGRGHIHFDPRNEDEINEYLEEACDKVWLMRLCDIAKKEPCHERSRAAMERILATYNDIPEDGYTDWECGYWNGILGALRWVMGEEKDFLDT